MSNTEDRYVWDGEDILPAKGNIGDPLPWAEVRTKAERSLIDRIERDKRKLVDIRNLTEDRFLRLVEGGFLRRDEN